MKFNIKSNKGMSLATIVVSIILMIIILSSIILSVNKTSEAKAAMQLNNDIEDLTRKVKIYYMKNGILPIDESEKVYIRKIKDKDVSDTSGESEISADYYRLMVSTFDNLNLRNEEKTEIIKDAEGNEKEKLIKGYVINKETHLIYYGEMNGSTFEVVDYEYKYSKDYDDFYKESIKKMKQLGRIPEKVESGEILKFSISGDQAIVTGLTEYGKLIQDLELVIPKYYKGKKVTKINKSAFSKCTKIKSVEASEFLVEVGQEAFSYCCGNKISDGVYEEGLENVSIPNLEKVGTNAFRNCYNLKEVNMPFLKYVGEKAFQQCHYLKGNIDFSKIKTVGIRSFVNCYRLDADISLLRLSSDEMPESVFMGCKELKGEIDLSYITTIGNSAFANCYKINIKDGNLRSVTSIGNAAFRMQDSNKSSIKGNENNVIFLDNLQILDYGVFGNCYQIKKVYMPNVSEIKDGVDSDSNHEGGTFRDCYGLEEIVIGEKLSYIGNYAFYYCINLKTITTEKIPESLVIGDYAFYHCTNDKNYGLQYFPDLNIKKVGTGSFIECYYLKTIDLSNTEIIGDKAFINCHRLTKIGKDENNYLENITQIGEKAFAACEAGEYKYLSKIAINKTNCNILKKEIFNFENQDERINDGIKITIYYGDSIVKRENWDENCFYGLTDNTNYIDGIDNDTTDNINWVKISE